MSRGIPFHPLVSATSDDAQLDLRAIAKRRQTVRVLATRGQTPTDPGSPYCTELSPVYGTGMLEFQNVGIFFDGLRLGAPGCRAVSGL